MADKPKSYVKNGYRYRTEKGGTRVLRIGKATPKKKGVDAVVADPKRLRKWLANPGLRSKLPEKYLSRDQQEERKLGEPVTPGSSMTLRDLRRDSKAATDLRYGGSIRDSQQSIYSSQAAERATSSWYDDYLRRLAQYQTDVGNSGTQAQQQASADFGAVRNLDNADAQAQAQANQQLAQVTGAKPLADATSSPASVVRQGLMASSGALLAGQSKNANDYASLLTNVVGPGGKMQALAGARARTLAAEKALAGRRDDARNYRASYEQQTISGEAKNALAAAIAQGKAAVDKYKADQAAATSRANNRRTNATSRANNRDTNATRRATDDGPTGGKNGTGGKTTKPKPLPKPSAGQITSFKGGYKFAKKQLGATPDWASDRLYRYMLKNNPDGTSPYLLRAAAEAARDGFIHAATANAIRVKLGIRVRDLGFPVRAGKKKTAAEQSPH